MPFIDYITWTPITYFVITSLLQLILLLIITSFFVGLPTWKQIGIAILGCVILGTVGYFTKEMTWPAALICFVVAFGVGLGSTKGEPMVSLLAAFAMFGVLIATSYYLVSPHTPIRIQQIGGATQYIRSYDRYDIAHSENPKVRSKTNKYLNLDKLNQ